MKCGRMIGKGNTAAVYEWEEGKVLDSETLLRYKKELADFYLAEMNATHDMIQDSLAVIMAARAGDVPECEN